MRPKWSAADLDLTARDQALMERAPENISNHRQGALIVRVVDGYGQPLPGVPVRYEQRRHAFLFGAHYPYHKRTYDLLQQAGINAATLWLGWSHVEPRPGVFNWGYLDQVWDPAALKRRKLVLTAHALNWFNASWNAFPSYLAELPVNQLPERVYDHTRTLLQRWAPYMDRVQIINEPLWHESNALGLNLDQVVRIAHAAALAVRDTLPSAEIEVNFCQVARVESYQASPFDLLKALDAADVPYDCIGLQALENSYTVTDPPIYYRGKTFAGILQMIRRYASVGKPLHISELCVPSVRAKSRPPRNHRSRYGAWNADLQARYLDAAYTLLFAEEWVHGITWWCPVDGDLAMIPGGGLLREDLSPKPAYRALADWTSRHTSAGIDHTNSEGSVYLRAYKGEYLISVGEGDLGQSVTAEIESPTVNEVTVVLGQSRRAGR